MRVLLARKGLILIAALLLLEVNRVGAGDFSFSIVGEVKFPLKITAADLQKMPAISLRLRRFSETGKYKGLCVYRGVPLRFVLEKAKIRKRAGAAFKHKSDVAIRLRGSSGTELTLSWGEVFYASNPTHYLLIFLKSVIRPTAHPSVRAGSCLNCHNGHTVRKGRLLPRVPREKLEGISLLLAKNGNVVQLLEDLRLIDVTSANRVLPRKSDRNHVYSSRVSVVEGKWKTSLANFLKSTAPKLRTFRLPEIGSGCGYHGTFSFSGYALSEIFARQISNPKFRGMLVSAPDGYRTFVSKNEIVGAMGRKAILAVRKNGSPLEKPEGKFMLVLPNDLFFDRWIRAVDRIEILTGAF